MLYNACYAKSSRSNEVVLSQQGINPLRQFPIKQSLVKGSWLLKILNEANEKIIKLMIWIHIFSISDV